MSDEHDEARIVMEELKRSAKRSRSRGGMAIFYRMNALSRVMERCPSRANIPYQIAARRRVLNRKEIKDVLA